jgi:hypothetical protein
MTTSTHTLEPNMDLTATLQAVPDPLRQLIDARLDTIERMLLGRVPRPDRLAIVRDVEGQIHEMLAARVVDETSPPDRDTVLGVLADLDPPEAYLPEDGPGATVGQGRLPVRLVPASALARGRRPGAGASSARGTQRLALWSGILGIVALLGAVGFGPFLYLLAVAFSSELLLLVGLPCVVVGTLLTAVLAIVLAAMVRLSRHMAIVGLVCGGLTLILDLLAALVLGFMLLSGG